MATRIGHGYDVHAFAAGRRLVLGGVDIPYELGLDGHSDADVVAHALADAILSAARIGDIGALFPPDDPAFLDADSLVLLSRAMQAVRRAGFELVDCDCTVAAQAPRITPYRDRMRENLARALGVSADSVGLKATTTEGLGFVGRREGIAAWAVALLESDAGISGQDAAAHEGDADPPGQDAAAHEGDLDLPGYDAKQER